jgi:hypothetical protein
LDSIVSKVIDRIPLPTALPATFRLYPSLRVTAGCVTIRGLYPVGTAGYQYSFIPHIFDHHYCLR